MSERKYLQVNLDTDTLPTSSVMHDANGNTLAKLDLNLSSNLIGNIAAGKLPKKVEMKVTKISLPVSNVPFSFAEVRQFTEHYITLKAAMILLPSRISQDGELYPNPSPIAGNPFFWPDNIVPRELRLPYPVSFADRDKWVDEAKRFSLIPINDFKTLLNAMTETHQFIADSCTPRACPIINYQIENNRLVFTSKAQYVKNGNAPLPQCSFYDRFRALSLVNGYNLVFQPVQYNWKECDPEVSSTSALNAVNPYLIAGNDHLRKLLPTLPWIKYDIANVPVADAVRARWLGVNNNDPSLYVLDTRTTSVYYSKSSPDTAIAETSSTQATTILWREGGTWEVKLAFEEINPISFCGVTSFVLMTNGLDATQQVFPINITENSDAATQIPILEVYHPVWKELNDRSDRIIVAKEEFTNTPIFTTNNYSSICDRNITFSFYNVLSGGKIYPLSLYPYTRFCLQLTLALYY